MKTIAKTLSLFAIAIFFATLTILLNLVKASKSNANVEKEVYKVSRIIKTNKPTTTKRFTFMNLVTIEFHQKLSYFKNPSDGKEYVIPVNSYWIFQDHNNVKKLVSINGGKIDIRKISTF